MIFGKKVILYKDGVPYVYGLTFKGWLYATWLTFCDWCKRVFRCKSEND